MKKFFCIFLLSLFGLFFPVNVYAGIPEFTLQAINCYGNSLPIYESVIFSLFSPKGNKIFYVLCMESNNVPYGFNIKFLPICKILLSECKKYRNDIIRVQISDEQYRKLRKICQVMFGRKIRVGLEEKEKMFRELLLDIFISCRLNSQIFYMI